MDKKPLLTARSASADYRIDNDLIKDSWRIAPEIEFDTLFISLFSEKENFVFYTNQDSIAFVLTPDQSYSFYVNLNDTSYALTIIQSKRFTSSRLTFDTISQNPELKFLYEAEDKTYLNLLRSKYPIDSLVQNETTDIGKVMKILHWVHNQWKHNGNNEPKKLDAISILKEAKQGKNFRCVEYGIVASACLNSIGLQSRTIALKTKDVETTEYEAGHVATEVYLNDLKKWVFIDGQWDAVPMLNNLPLNAVEFQKAISENYEEVEIKSLSGASKRGYIQWIYPYLFYFDVAFDNRENQQANKFLIDGKRSLMLVPVGEKDPKVFQRYYPMDYFIHTHSLNDFYKKP